MAIHSALTLSDVDEFAARLRVTVMDAERYHQIAGAIGKLVPSSGAQTPRAAGSKRGPKVAGRRGGNPELESNIIELVKATKGGLGSIELTKETGAPKQRVKAIAQKLKVKGIFRVVGKKRSAKYQFAG